MHLAVPAMPLLESGTSEHSTYGYDDRNQLTQVKHYDATNTLVMAEENKYDYFELRIEKSVSDGVTTEVSRYAQDGWNPAQPSNIGTEGLNVWAKLDGSSSLETRYFSNDDVDHLIARIDHIDTTAVQLWYSQDYQNSTRHVLDQTGTVVDSLSYDSYGNIDVGSELDPSMRGDYAWTGREIDVETELQYNRARWYDGTTGKWISQAPLGFDAGDSNLYRYVNNRPTIATDPSGTVFRIVGQTVVTDVQFSFVWDDQKMGDKVIADWKDAKDETEKQRKEKFISNFVKQVVDTWNQPQPFRLVSSKQKGRIDSTFGFLPVLKAEAKNFNFEKPDPEAHKFVIHAIAGSSTESDKASPIGIAYVYEGNTRAQTETQWKKQPTKQWAAAHEFGHLIGLQHPGYLLADELLSETDPTKEYTADPFALMGHGSDLRGYFFKPWVQYLNKEKADAAPWYVLAAKSHKTYADVFKNYDTNVNKLARGHPYLLFEYRKD